MFRVDKLNYYDKFHCIMGKCPENCCEMNWNILVDEATYKKYQGCEDEQIRNFMAVLDDLGNGYIFTNTEICMFIFYLFS